MSLKFGDLALRHRPDMCHVSIGFSPALRTIQNYGHCGVSRSNLGPETAGALHVGPIVTPKALEQILLFLGCSNHQQQED